MRTNKNLRILACAMMALTFMPSCGEEKKEEENQEARLLREKNLAEVGRRDSLERIYITTLDEIDQNLDLIRDKYGYLTLGPNSNSDYSRTDKKEQIINNISMINGLLEENKAKVEKMEKSLAYYKGGKAELLKSIELVKEKVKEQELEISDLKIMLAERDFRINELNSTIAQNTTTIGELQASNNEKEKSLNKIYFYCGTYDELKNKNIIKKEGGVLGIRKVKVLNEKLDSKDFVEFDRKNTTSFAMLGNKPKVITKHPEGSYVIEKEEESDMAVLKITDPESFWKVSKYLVIEIQ